MINLKSKNNFLYKLLEKRFDNNNLLGNILLLYIFTYFFMPYKPWTSIISFHSMILPLGFILILWGELKKMYSGKFVLREDIIVLGCAIFFFVFSSIFAHPKEFTRAGFQPYILAFMCFIFVRFAIKNLNLKRFYNFTNIYLVFSGIIILLQINLGDVFYISGLFGKKGFALGCQGWGFADTPTLAGGIMMWFLSVSIVCYSFAFRKANGIYYEMFNLSAIAFGAVGLFYTVNRGSWIGALLGLILTGVFLFIYNAPKKYFYRATLSIITFMIIFGCLIRPEVYKMDEKISFLKKVTFMPLKTMKHDSSVNTRLKAWGLCIDLIKKHPVWGIGLLQYPIYYEKIFPKKLIIWDDHGYLYSKDGYLDPNPRQIPHNSYLYYMTEVGVLPAIPLFVLIGLIVIRGIRSGPKSKSFPFLIGLISICAWVGTCDYINERIFWIALASVAGLVFNDKKKSCRKIKNNNFRFSNIYLQNNQVK